MRSSLASPRTVVALSAAALVVLSLLVALTHAPEPDSDAAWDAAAERLLSRTLDGPLPDLVPESRNSRRAAVYVGVLITGLLSLLYAFRRQRYIAEWVGVWLLLSISGYIISRGYQSADTARLGVGLLEGVKVAIALLLVKSAHSFAGTARPRGAVSWLLLPLLLAWLAVSANRLSVAGVLAPAYVLTGLVHLRGALLFGSIGRSRRMIGALLLAVCLTLVGVANVVFGLFFERALSSGQLVLLFLSASSVCFLVMAFGMTVLIFEAMNAELTTVNEQLREAHRTLEALATTDALTGCYNRHYLEAQIGRELEHHRRYDTPLSLLFVDIDRFKSINDTCGHQTGDRVLQYVGAFLQGNTRAGDYVVRWGGDEFLVLMRCTGAEAAAKVAALSASFDQKVDADALPPGVSVSIGYVEIPADATDLQPFIELADRQMYSNKTAGIATA